MSFKPSKLLTNDWIITLSATLIGVFVALYLNEWMATRKLNHQKSIATKNILDEISSNNTKLKRALDKHQELFDIMSFIGEYIDGENNLIAPTDSLTKIRGKYPDFFTISDSTLVEKNIYDYDGEMNFDLSFPQFELTTIAWSTLKDSGISASYGFECLMYLETIENLTEEILIQNKDLIAYFTGSKDTGDNNEKMINHIKLMMNFEESLIGLYDESKNELANCD